MNQVQQIQIAPRILYYYLRASASSSARLSSVSGAETIFGPFILSGSPLNKTNLPKQSSSASERFSALIWSLMIRSGLRNQSKKASLGLFVLVISVTLSSALMENKFFRAQFGKVTMGGEAMLSLTQQYASRVRFCRTYQCLEEAISW